MKTFAAAVLVWLALASACSAAPWDWQGPAQLPPRYRNHCSAERFTDRPYCSNHCGTQYQFYHCSEVSFGCCHLGHGDCDFRGVLRCHA